MGFTATALAGTPVWRPVGINPVFRVMRYQEGGWLVPHYDGPFVMDARRQTGMTVVLYLEESPGGGGQLRFLKDDQQDLPAIGRRKIDRLLAGQRPEAAVEQRGPCQGARGNRHQRQQDDVSD